MVLDLLSVHVSGFDAHIWAHHGLLSWLQTEIHVFRFLQ